MAGRLVVEAAGRRGCRGGGGSSGVGGGGPDSGAVGRQCGLERTGEWARVVRGSVGEQGPGVRRGDPCARTCKTRALGAPSTRMLHARRNARACKRARVRLGISRPGLGLATSLVDKLVGSEDQVYNANKRSCQICACTQGV